MSGLEPFLVPMVVGATVGAGIGGITGGGKGALKGAGFGGLGGALGPAIGSIGNLLAAEGAAGAAAGGGTSGLLNGAILADVAKEAPNLMSMAESAPIGIDALLATGENAMTKVPAAEIDPLSGLASETFIPPAAPAASMAPTAITPVSKTSPWAGAAAGTKDVLGATLLAAGRRNEPYMVRAPEPRINAGQGAVPVRVGMPPVKKPMTPLEKFAIYLRSV